MPKNKISDLRNHLFETLERLKDGEIEVDKALAIVKVSHAIVSTAKVEVDAMRAIGAAAPGNPEFFGVQPEPPESRELPESATRLTRQLADGRLGGKVA